MSANEKITVRQLVPLIVFHLIGNVMWHAPAPVVTEARQGGWISAAIALAVGMLLAWFYASFGRSSGSDSFTRFCERAAGRWLGVAAALVFMTFTLTQTTFVLRSTGHCITTEVLPNTPILFVHISFMAIAVYSTYLGLETIARAGTVFFPWVIAAIAICLAFISPRIEPAQATPILEFGMGPVLLGTLPVLSPFMELAVYVLLIPHLNLTARIGRAFRIGTLAGGVVHVVIVAMTILVLGVDITQRQIFPSYILFKQISVGGFIERVEIPLSVMVLFVMFFKLTMSFLFSAMLLAQTLRLNDYRPLLLPLAIFTVAYANIMYPNMAYALRFIHEIYPYFAAVFVLLLLLLRSAVKLRGRKNAPKTPV